MLSMAFFAEGMKRSFLNEALTARAA